MMMPTIISMPRLRAIVFVIVACAFSCVLRAQSGPEQSSMSQQANAAPLDQTRDQEASLLTEQDGQLSLSASQIISILQSRPEVVVEIKQLVAQSQPGSIPAQPDAITDEALYSEITTNKALRQQITLFLRARGYVSDDDLSLKVQRSQQTPQFADPFSAPGTNSPSMARQSGQNLQMPLDDADLQRPGSSSLRPPALDSQ